MKAVIKWHLVDLNANKQINKKKRTNNCNSLVWILLLFNKLPNRKGLMVEKKNVDEKSLKFFFEKRNCCMPDDCLVSKLPQLHRKIGIFWRSRAFRLYIFSGAVAVCVDRTIDDYANSLAKSRFDFGLS